MTSREDDFLKSNRDFIPSFQNMFEDPCEESLNFSNFSIDTISKVNPTDITMVTVMCDSSTNTQLTFPPNVYVEFQIVDFPSLSSPQLTPIKARHYPMMESPEFASPDFEFKSPRRKHLEI
jgi:hypothetical protein